MATQTLNAPGLTLNLAGLTLNGPVPATGSWADYVDLPAQARSTVRVARAAPPTGVGRSRQMDGGL